MQADRSGKLYAGVADAFRKIMAQEGVSGLLRGLGPNVQRGFLVNAAELGTYDHCKQLLGQYCSNLLAVHVGASAWAGFAGAVASNPIDVVKTRLMAQPSGSRQLYSGIVDCMIKTVSQEGPLALYKGFVPNWCMPF